MDRVPTNFEMERDLKKNYRGIWLTLVMFISFGLAFGDPIPVYIYKVKMVMKNGSGISGYVFWNQEVTETASFEPRKFLEHWLNHPYDIHEFELVKAVFPIQDKGALGGLAHLKKDRIKVDSRLVASIASVPNPYDGREVTCAFPELTEEDIAVMKNPLVDRDSIPLDESDATALSYDPRIKKAQLHNLLLKFKKMEYSENGEAKIEKWKREVKPPKVVIVLSGCD